MATTKTKLVLGRGKVYFEPFLPGTLLGDGERYIGNTTEFQVDREITTLKRFTSHGGRRVERDSKPIQEKNEVSFVTDNIVLENVGLWYGIDSYQTIVTGINQVTESFSARPNRYYQLGMLTYPQGVRSVENVVVRVGDVVVPADGNYIVDAVMGRLQVLDTSTVLMLGVDFDVDFEWRTTSLDFVASEPTILTGALRFIAHNAHGQNRNYYFPRVQIAPTGSVDFKGDTFQQIAFSADVREKAPGFKQIYVDSILDVGTTEDEQAILNEGSLTLAEFPIYEDILDQSVNFGWPRIIL